MCEEIKNLYNDYPFLKEVDSCSLRCTVFNFEDAFKNYYSKRSIILNLRVNLISKAIELHVLKVRIKIGNTVI